MDLCTVEGVVDANSVPGVHSNLLVPNGTCSFADQTCGTDLECDLTVPAGDVCQCNSTTGSDTCKKYSPCVPTPCKLCSDCLANMTEFAESQRFTLDTAKLSADFSVHCTARGYNNATCDLAAKQISDSNRPIAFGKRAGQLCQAMGFCNVTLFENTCQLKPTANLTVNGTTLHLCKLEGVADGKDLLGIKSVKDGVPDLESGWCDQDSDCQGTDQMCDKTTTAPFCTCYRGVDRCRNIGKCVLKPCPSCSKCLTDFQAFVTSAAGMTTASNISAAFEAECNTKRNASSDMCASAALSIRNSYKGNAGRRAGSICRLLGECVPSDSRMAGCK